MPSLIGGFALGSLFAISSIRIRDGLDYAYEAAGQCPFTLPMTSSCVVEAYRPAGEL